MFSKEFMRYLLNYEPDGCEEKKTETVKEIRFKEVKNPVFAKVYVTITK